MDDDQLKNCCLLYLKHLQKLVDLIRYKKAKRPELKGETADLGFSGF